MKKFCLILVFLLNAINSAKASEIKADPTLIITTLDGKNFDLKEKLGKVVIINFWAKWCADCRKEMLILDEIYRDYKSRNLEIIGINIGRKRERQKVLEFSSSLSYPNAMFIDAKETSFEEPNAIPVSYVINKDGKLVKKISADDVKLTKQDFENILKPLLKNLESSY
jgi:thiol-disulfide isomerase/thioredoxin